MKQINIRGPIVSDDEKWIYDWFEMACTTPGDFLAQLQEADGDDVCVLINSVGGYVMEAAEIYEAIRSYSGNVTGKVVGQACSCASFIACAMYCEISPIGEIFIHNCSGGVEGDYRAMQQMKDQLLQTNDNIILAYQEKTGLSKDQLQKMMDKNTTLSAREAVELGFVDKISENSNYDPKIDDRGMVAASFGGMLPIANLSDQKRMALAAAARGLQTTVGANNLPQEKEEHMGKLSDFLASNKDANEEYQALLEKAKKEAREEGVTAERARISAIDQIAGNIAQDLVHNAKYDKPVSAETLALEALKSGSIAQKTPESVEDQTGNVENSQTDTGAGSVNLEQLAKMAADYAISNAKDLQSPAKDPLTGASGKEGTAADQMAKDASESIKKYL
ncbi:MAG: Clp protease ClpP [Eubacterium sp.]|nr:Clp protease ClpP [Eubacterium sp.]